MRQVFKVVMQPDTIGNRLKEVQQSVLDLAKFGEKSRLPGSTAHDLMKKQARW